MLRTPLCKLIQSLEKKQKTGFYLFLKNKQNKPVKAQFLITDVTNHE